ncbi:MAG: hypothetical protein IV100_30815 [Myxococcales bacterium]|nr:hypothetical protein [Myxococcales bacterium]
MTTRHWLTITAASLSLACSAALPPERLVSIDAELARGDVTELAETQARHIGEARQRRDAAWKAYRAGEPVQADLQAWIAWQQLRIAENLDVIGRQAAVAEARGHGHEPDNGADVAAVPLELDRPTSRGRATTPTRTASPPAPRTAVQAVQDAEDARLRLVSTGGQRDWRWPEGEALLQTAQRALERGSYDRAEQLADRALFVFEMVRLSAAPVDGVGAAPPPWSGPGAAAPNARSIPAPSRAYVDASIRVSRARPRAAALGCSADVETAESLLRQAEGRRLAGDGGGADAHVAIATDHVKRCDALETRQVAVRIAPLRETAQTLARRLPSPIDRGKIKALLAQADAALEDGDLDGAEALLLEATGQPRLKPPIATAETAPAAAAPPAAATATKSAVPAGQTPNVGSGLTVAPTLAPVIPLGGGGTAAAVEPKTNAPEANSKVVREGPDEVPPAGPRSRILSERLEPLTAPETPVVGPDPAPTATPDDKSPPAPTPEPK